MSNEEERLASARGRAERQQASLGRRRNKQAHVILTLVGQNLVMEAQNKILNYLDEEVAKDPAFGLAVTDQVQSEGMWQMLQESRLKPTLRDRWSGPKKRARGNRGGSKGRKSARHRKAEASSSDTEPEDYVDLGPPADAPGLRESMAVARFFDLVDRKDYRGAKAILLTLDKGIMDMHFLGQVYGTDAPTEVWEGTPIQGYLPRQWPIAYGTGLPMPTRGFQYQVLDPRATTK
jgi:hypothetical protein